ncbi:MAG: protein phosphatase 2C domain-containing protein [Cyanobacteria bacterium P01_H01_bin.15]
MLRDYAGATDCGLVRAVNQDSLYLDEANRFFIVADGMGGYAGGQEASKIAVTKVVAHLEAYWQSSLPIADLLKQACFRANEAILRDQDKHPERRDMGTTITAVVFRNDEVWFAQVGDSRLYRFQDSQLEQITQDDTWVALALNLGEMTPEQAKIHPWRHVLSKCLGRQDLYEITVRQIPSLPGQRLMLCSDGLTEELSDTDIQTILSKNPPPEIVSQQLIEAAKKAGGSDNITVIVIDQKN